MSESTTPILYTNAQWRKDVSCLLLQLVQEIGALNPGLRIEANLNSVIQAAAGSPHSREE